MKNKTKELDVDFIGGQEALTKDEELMISKFIKALKENPRKKRLGVKRIKRAKFLTH
jgi:hypothetical protein